MIGIFVSHRLQEGCTRTALQARQRTHMEDLAQETKPIYKENTPCGIAIRQTLQANHILPYKLMQRKRWYYPFTDIPDKVLHTSEQSSEKTLDAQKATHAIPVLAYLSFASQSHALLVRQSQKS